MRQLWVVLCEVQVEPGDMPSGATVAFSNIVTWGETSFEVKAKIQDYLASFRWNVISYEKTEPVNDAASYGEELEELIDKAASNSDAILIGSFFSYKPV